MTAHHIDKERVTLGGPNRDAMTNDPQHETCDPKPKTKAKRRRQRLGIAATGVDLGPRHGPEVACELALFDEDAWRLWLDFETLRRHARSGLQKFITSRTKRRPAVVPVVMEFSISMMSVPVLPPGPRVRTISGRSPSPPRSSA